MSVRIDKWLWAARFYKTRSLATAAVAGGKVHLNGDRAKPAKGVVSGDALRIRIGPYEYVVTVRALAERRGSAKDAATLYEETPESERARLALARQIKQQAIPVYEGKGRPTKRDRRRMERLKGS